MQESNQVARFRKLHWHHCTLYLSVCISIWYLAVDETCMSSQDDWESSSWMLLQDLSSCRCLHISWARPSPSYSMSSASTMETSEDLVEMSTGQDLARTYSILAVWLSVLVPRFSSQSSKVTNESPLWIVAAVKIPESQQTTIAQTEHPNIRRSWCLWWRVRGFSRCRWPQHAPDLH